VCRPYLKLKPSDLEQGYSMRRNVRAQPPIESESLKIRKPKQVAAGIGGVASSFRIGLTLIDQSSNSVKMVPKPFLPN
jgi:hypothetical protein